MQKKISNSNNPAQQQNISINISYNLNTHKPPKSILPQKKVSSKIKKIPPSTGLQAIGNDFFNNIAFNGMNQGKKQLKKQNLIKKSNQSSLQFKQSKSLQSQKLTLKKKKPISIQKQPLALTQSNQDSTPFTVTQYYNPLAQNAKHFLKRAIQSPDIFKITNDRKLKTQGSIYETMGEGMTNVGKKKKGTINFRQKQGGLFGKHGKISNLNRQTGCNLMAGKLPSSLKTMPRKSLSNTKPPKNKARQCSLKQKQKRLQTQQNQTILHMNQQVQGRHNKSCMLYSTKKSAMNNIITEPNLLQAAENLMSQYVSINSTKGKKRAQSAYMFGGKDNQLVSKLLNLSVISSQLGSSQLISSERMQSGRNDLTRKRLGLKVDELDQPYGHFQPNFVKNAAQLIKDRKKEDQITKRDNNHQPGNALRQYLNSIDLRVIKNIQADTANISSKNDQPENKPNQFIRFNEKLKNQKTQLFSQKTNHILNPPQPNVSQSDIISFYDKLFSNALQNKLQQQQQRYIESAASLQNKNSSLQFDNTTKLKKERFMIKGLEQKHSEDEDNVSSLDEREQTERENQYHQIVEKGQKNEGAMKLNFRHYKQLLNKQGGRQNKDKDITKQFDFSLMQCQNIHNTHQRSNNQQTNLQIQSKQSQQSDFIDLLEQSPTSSPLSLSYLKQEQMEKSNIETMLRNNKDSNIEKYHSNWQLNQNQNCNQNQKDEYQRSSNNQNSTFKPQNYPQINPFISSTPKYVSGNQSIPVQQKSLSPPIKSPKHSNRSKVVHIEPQYNQICWQYNGQQLEKELEINNEYISTSNNKYEQKHGRNINNSPNNCSEDGIGSGDEEYDSKKYSSTEQYGQYDRVVEAMDAQKQGGDRLLIEQRRYDDNISCDGQQEQEQMSYEEKEINCSERWVNPNFGKKQDLKDEEKVYDSIQKQLDINQERVKIVKINPYHQKNDNKSQNNYLQCSLEDFGVKNAQKPQRTNHSILGNSSPKQVETETPMQNNFIQLSQNLTHADSHALKNITFALSINDPQTVEDISLPNNKQKTDAFSQIRKKRLTSIVEDLILELIRQFARDISYILKKSSHEKRTQQQFDQNSSPFRSYKQFEENEMLSPFSRGEEELLEMGDSGVDQSQRYRRKEQLAKKSQLVGKCFGIDTSFGSVQGYLKEFKSYLMRDELMKQAIIKNINKDIGPNSLQILSYLRPQYEGISSQMNQFSEQPSNHNQQQACEDQEDGLFVVPSEAFSEFENFLQNQLDEHNKLLEPERQIILTQKQKRNNNFWHRGIYESWNQFLDYERPYGINGKPYEWIQEKKKFRSVQIQSIEHKLQKAIDKLLQTISLPSGIIYDKYDQTPIYSDLTQQQKIYLNQERLSRMLAIELFESEQTWINYNDEMAELLVELSRVIEERIFFQMGTQLKKIFRNRKLILTNIQPNHPQIESNNTPNFTNTIQHKLNHIHDIDDITHTDDITHINDINDMHYLSNDPMDSQQQ